MTEYDGEEITYDTIGNPLHYRDGMTMTWKHGRSLESITKDGERLGWYNYNGDGLRTYKSAAGYGSVEYHILDGEYVGQSQTIGGKRYDTLYLYDDGGNIIGLQEDGETYYFVRTLQGNVAGILDAEGTQVAIYTYDTWGNVSGVYNGNWQAVTDPEHIAVRNPFRYRGYMYDEESGLYYLESRYYDPVTGRFVNADGYVSTGTGLMGHNMFAYCNNNPVMYVDPSGEFLGVALGALLIGAVAILTSCSAEPEPYESADEAAMAFSEEVYSSGSYVRHEYAANIYSRTVDGKTTYNYTSPHSGGPHSVSIDNSTPSGTTLVAYAHTHPNSNIFSDADIKVARKFEVDAYVVGPNLNLQRYNYASSTVISVGLISPDELTDAQKKSLVAEFRESWDEHVSSGCDFGCDSMEWPTP